MSSGIREGSCVDRVTDGRDVESEQRVAVKAVESSIELVL